MNTRTIYLTILACILSGASTEPLLGQSDGASVAVKVGDDSACWPEELTRRYFVWRDDATDVQFSREHISKCTYRVVYAFRDDPQKAATDREFIAVLRIGDRARYLKVLKAGDGWMPWGLDLPADCGASCDLSLSEETAYSLPLEPDERYTELRPDALVGGSNAVPPTPEPQPPFAETARTQDRNSPPPSNPSANEADESFLFNRFGTAIGVSLLLLFIVIAAVLQRSRRSLHQTSTNRVGSSHPTKPTASNSALIDREALARLGLPKVVASVGFFVVMMVVIGMSLRGGVGLSGGGGRDYTGDFEGTAEYSLGRFGDGGTAKYALQVSDSVFGLRKWYSDGSSGQPCRGTFSPPPRSSTRFRVRTMVVCGGSAFADSITFTGNAWIVLGVRLAPSPDRF